MSDIADQPVASDTTSEQRISALLGGDNILHRRVVSPMDAHAMLLEGMPGRAVNALLDRLTSLRHNPDLPVVAFGMSMRTLQRHKSMPPKTLNADQSGKTWRFAEILAKATEVFGSQEAAEHWMEEPALGLDGQRPIELLRTSAGAEIVKTFLIRLEYDVYT